jgi:hypothetical protein
MSMPVRIALGLIALAWAALVTALIAIHFTPRSFCNELPAPAGWTMTFWGLVAAGSAAFVAMGVATFGERSLRMTLGVVGLGLATLFGISGVGVIWSHHVVSMTACG